MSAPTDVLPLQDAFDDEALTAAWRERAQALDASFFVTPVWARAWWEWGERPPGRLAVWETGGGELDAVAALVESRVQLHRRVPVSVPVLTNLGSGPGAADHCGWLAPEDRLPHVWEWVERQRESRPLLLRALDPAAAGSAPAGAVEVERSRCPRQAIGGDAEPPGSSSFRKKIRQYERRLDREGVSLRWVPPARLDEAIVDCLYSLHEDRHSLKEEDSTFRTSQKQMHERLVQLATADCGPAAVLAQTDDEAIGILYGFLCGRTFAYYQSGWSADWARFSVGTVLIANAMRHAADEGATVFDFLRGADDYKYRFGAEDRCDSTLLLASGIRGRLLRMKFRVRRQLQDDGPD